MLSTCLHNKRKKRNPLFPCANFGLVTINVLSSIVISSIVMYITNIVVQSIIKIKN